MWSLLSPQPRPSRISTASAWLTMSREARSFSWGSYFLHEAVAVAVGEVAALAARALGDQAADAVDARRMELHELHVLQRQAGAQHHGVAVAGAGVGRGAGLVDAAAAAGGDHRGVGAEAVQGAVLHADRHQAAAGAVLVHQEVDGEVLDEEARLVLEALLVERVQDGVAGAVGGGAGALRHLALGVVRGVAAEAALVDQTLRRPAERHAEMLQLDHRGHRLAAEVLRRVVVGEPDAARDRVVHVPAPVVLGHVAERGGDAALGRDRVAAGRKQLGDAGGAQARGAHAEGGAQARTPRAQDDHVERVVDDLVTPAHRDALTDREES